MFRALAIWITILNTLTITLSDAMLVVEEEAIELGDITVGESRRAQIDYVDSVRVVFRIGDEWIRTDLVELRDTIRIDDNTETFEVEVEFFE